ncbi:Proteasome adapter and scaffold protein ECM29 [Geodia barretti]|uniref:Proteasome adapter and scaffold protein ECM29 n=1 Tax=Geodia barretti TaxID=519541 RepID=A0AA35TUP2_GEOBA|nr:Proteasome adapter and scaffold protein ECM29 [Geodia barretti]
MVPWNPQKQRILSFLLTINLLNKHSESVFREWLVFSKEDQATPTLCRRHVLLWVMPVSVDHCLCTQVSAEGEKGENDGGGITVVTLIARLKKLLNSTKEIRTRELCAVALGRMGLFDSAHSPALLQALFSVREEKAVELQFTVGEALSCVAAGPLSTALHSPWDLRHRLCSESSDVPSEQLSKTLDAILSDHASHPLASVRQSACTWLLCLVKHASRHPSMKNNLKRLQATFVNFLAETNEITQEVASRGLGLTYDLCDGSVKQEMVQSLVGTLMEGRRIEQKVTDDTEVFKQGELGKAPEGKGLSTYKELCSLASDLNKPDLIYKFMNLANHNALWNSKKGAAFGFSVIAATAREELSSHLPLLVPRLYRYKYDPNPRVQLAMSSIWAAVVPESKKAVDKYLPAIIDDLSQNLNSHLWRNRQASCMALGDVLIGQEVKDVASHLPSLWELSLRARDDVKETVRKAADVACKALHKVTVRACESPTLGAKVIGEVLPLMLNKGMQNPSSDIRKISLLAILKMSENAGSQLKPHIPVLVPTLLESLSSLEPQELNTLSLRLTGETEVLEQLDNIRVKVSRQSPMMETIELCIPNVDGEVLTGLVPRLVDIFKSGVGLGTKAATAQLVVSLVRSCRNDLTPHAGKLLTALTNGLLDRSVGVRKSSAQAIGHLVKVSKTVTIKKLLDKMNKWYFEKNDPLVTASVALVFHSISRHSPDTAGSLMTDFIPLVFLAMHTKTTDEDPDSKAVVKQWEETWSEVVPGEEATVRLYLPQLVGVASSALQSQSWPIKSQGAAALATVAEKMGSSLPQDQLAIILNTQLDGLQGRTWNGKVSL